MVHPGLLWVEPEPAAVEEDGGFEVLAVSEATDTAFDGHDFSVDAFGYGVGDLVSAVAHDIFQAFLDRSRDGLHRCGLQSAGQLPSGNSLRTRTSGLTTTWLTFCRFHV